MSSRRPPSRRTRGDHGTRGPRALRLERHAPGTACRLPSRPSRAAPPGAKRPAWRRRGGRRIHRGSEHRGVVRRALHSLPERVSRALAAGLRSAGASCDISTSGARARGLRRARLRRGCGRPPGERLAGTSRGAVPGFLASGPPGSSGMWGVARGMYNRPALPPFASGPPAPAAPAWNGEHGAERAPLRRSLGKPGACPHVCAPGGARNISGLLTRRARPIFCRGAAPCVTLDACRSAATTTRAHPGPQRPGSVAREGGGVPGPSTRRVVGETRRRAAVLSTLRSGVRP